MVGSIRHSILLIYSIKPIITYEVNDFKMVMQGRISMSLEMPRLKLSSVGLANRPMILSGS